MRRYAIALLLFLLLAAPSTAKEPTSEDPSVSAGVNAFACDLYARLSGEPGNLFLSPYSIAVTMAMVREGANAETAAEMAAVLHLPAEGAAEGHRALTESLKPGKIWDGRTKVPAYELDCANALWVQKGVSLLSPFTVTLRDAFGAPPERIDFAHRARARARINAWVLEQTKGKIENIIPAGKPGPDTRLVLANAIYFKAPWQEPFKEQNTARGSFTTTSGRSVRPKMMTQTEQFRYAETEAAQILEMTYKGGETAMTLLLPKAGDGLPALEKALGAAELSAWIGKLTHRSVKVTIPRFEITCDFDLTATLPAMGMPRAFDPERADFTKMTTEVPLFIGAVLHKAFVAVDEEGTEAAAATVATMSLGAAPEPTKPVVFRADHPFLILIRHVDSGCILFMGRVEDPTKGA
jgi:serpin B